MKIRPTAALAAVLVGVTFAHADERGRYHDEAGLWVALGIFADAVGASLLADLIAPPPPAEGCVGFCGRPDDAPPGDPPPGYSAPGYAAPPCSSPGASRPDYSQPDYSQPDYSQPDYAQPNYTRPDEAPPDDAPPGYGPYYGDIGTRRAADAVWAAPY
jgi:hypothetical protein